MDIEKQQGLTLRVTKIGKGFAPLPNPHCERGVKWWRGLSVCGNGRLGAAWAAVRSCYWGVHFAVDESLACYSVLELTNDERALNALWLQRGQDLSDLLSAFGIMPSQAPERKSPGRR